MADARNARLSHEVLAAAPISASLTRQGVQFALNNLGLNAASTASLARLSHEVLAETPTSVSMTRQGVQLALNNIGLNTGAVAKMARLSGETLASVPPTVAMTRQGVQLALNNIGLNTDANASLARYSFEALARSFIPMTGFSAPAGWELFLHNWLLSSVVESTYSTDITSASSTVSEDRTGLLQKPWRSITQQWEIKGNENANRMLVELRRLVNETSVIPLTPDAVTLNTSGVVGPGNDTVYGDFSKGRFFQNGPVVLVSLSRITATEEEVLSWEVLTIDTPFEDRLKFTSDFTANVATGYTVAIPLMQVHPQTELRFKLASNNTIQIKATFEEIYGETALPPTASDLPSNFNVYDGLPIMTMLPHYASGLKMRFRREGSLGTLGRGRVVYQRGTRHRVLQDLTFREDRAGAWDIIEFFDTRRGRLRPFWVLDPENVFDVVGISPTFVSVSPNGELVDFQAEMEWFGLVFSDGTSAVRQATTIQDVAGVWRLTLDSAMPAGYSHTDVVTFGRARKCRMQEDELVENWSNTGVCTMRVPVIELLEEGEITL